MLADAVQAIVGGARDAVVAVRLGDAAGLGNVGTGRDVRLHVHVETADIGHDDVERAEVERRAVALRRDLRAGRGCGAGRAGQRHAHLALAAGFQRLPDAGDAAEAHDAAAQFVLRGGIARRAGRDGEAATARGRGAAGGEEEREAEQTEGVHGEARRQPGARGETLRLPGARRKGLDARPAPAGDRARAPAPLAREETRSPD